MEKCYEYFGCRKTECPMYRRKDVNCWELEETLCFGDNNEFIKSKLFGTGKKKCDICIYYNCCLTNPQRVIIEEKSLFEAV